MEGMGMVQRAHTLLTDDVDGGEAAETVRFALDGVEYEIDLNEQHARELREAVSRFVDAARRVGGGRARSSARSSVGSSAGSSARRDSDRTRAIRVWASENGHQLSERGRIPDSVLSAYEAAH
jgi:Lsr2